MTSKSDKTYRAHGGFGEKILNLSPDSSQIISQLIGLFLSPCYEKTVIYPFLCTQGHKVATAPTLSLYKLPLFVRLGSHCNAIFKRRYVTVSKRY